MQETTFFRFQRPTLPSSSSAEQTSASDVLKVAVNRTVKAIVEARGIGCHSAQAADLGQGLLRNCSVTVADPYAPLQNGVNESYTVSISSEGRCSIAAHTPWSAIHAMETLSQVAGENCTVVNAPLLIEDKPRFGFRGLMIDTARHFLPVSFIKHIIDGMAINKLNILQ